jgi:hypothetical protein
VNSCCLANCSALGGAPGVPDGAHFRVAVSGGCPAVSGRADLRSRRRALRCLGQRDPTPRAEWTAPVYRPEAAPASTDLASSGATSDLIMCVTDLESCGSARWVGHTAPSPRRSPTTCPNPDPGPATPTTRCLPPPTTTGRSWNDHHPSQIPHRQPSRQTPTSRQRLLAGSTPPMLPSAGQRCAACTAARGLLPVLA